MYKYQAVFLPKLTGKLCFLNQRFNLPVRIGKIDFFETFDCQKALVNSRTNYNLSHFTSLLGQKILLSRFEVLVDFCQSQLAKN